MAILCRLLLMRLQESMRQVEAFSRNHTLNK
jgi:hypothetical protein